MNEEESEMYVCQRNVNILSLHSLSYSLLSSASALHTNARSAETMQSSAVSGEEGITTKWNTPGAP